MAQILPLSLSHGFLEIRKIKKKHVMDPLWWFMFHIMSSLVKNKTILLEFSIITSLLQYKKWLLMSSKCFIMEQVNVFLEHNAAFQCHSKEKHVGFLRQMWERKGLVWYAFCSWSNRSLLVKVMNSFSMGFSLW